MKMFNQIIIWMGSLLFALSGVSADGASVVSKPEPWQIGFQEAASPTMQRIAEFHDYLLYFLYAIVIVVFILLAWVVIRYRAKKNPNPSKNTHNTLIEVIWTAVPVIILVFIAIPSFRLLNYLNQSVEGVVIEQPQSVTGSVDGEVPPVLTVKTIGYQWYWGYEYSDHDVTYDSYMKDKDEIKKTGGEYLLSVDEPLVLPVNTRIRFIMEAEDVIHSFSVPALGVKTDCIPGHSNETWTYINKPGIYYGNCTELCGKGHAYMPVEVRAVSIEEFNAWVQKRKSE